jgi:hypothetical protein
MSTQDGRSGQLNPGRRQPRASDGAPRRRVYVAAALITAAIAIAGFWPTYFGPLVAGTVDVPAVIHVHAVVYVGWLILFIAQVAFAATRRVRLHVRLGRWIMAYGIVLVGAGLMAMWEGFGARLATGDTFRAQRWLFGVLRDLTFFPFLAAGWVYRRQPEIHKRLMIVATSILVLPAVGRMTFLGPPFHCGSSCSCGRCRCTSRCFTTFARKGSCIRCM